METECNICLDDKPTHTTHYHCTHWNCTGCYERMGWGRPCPLCRTPIAVRWYSGPSQLFVRDMQGRTAVLQVDLQRTTWDCAIRMMLVKWHLEQSIKLVHPGARTSRMTHYAGDTTLLASAGVTCDDTLHIFGYSAPLRLDVYEK